MSRPRAADRFKAGRPARGGRFGVIASRFNHRITRVLASAAVARLRKLGAAKVDLVWVPGSFELPLAARAMADTGMYRGIVCVGAVIRGETTHHEHVAGGCVAGLQLAMQATGIPVGFGVITADTEEQAKARACPRGGRNMGADAASAAAGMAGLLAGIRRAGR